MPWAAIFLITGRVNPCKILSFTPTNRSIGGYGTDCFQIWGEFFAVGLDFFLLIIAFSILVVIKLIGKIHTERKKKEAVSSRGSSKFQM